MLAQPLTDQTLLLLEQPLNISVLSGSITDKFSFVANPISEGTLTIEYSDSSAAEGMRILDLYEKAKIPAPVDKAQVTHLGNKNEKKVKTFFDKCVKLKEFSLRLDEIPCCKFQKHHSFLLKSLSFVTNSVTLFGLSISAYYLKRILLSARNAEKVIISECILQTAKLDFGNPKVVRLQELTFYECSQESYLIEGIYDMAGNILGAALRSSLTKKGMKICFEVNGLYFDHDRIKRKIGDVEDAEKRLSIRATMFETTFNIASQDEE
ncbi:unnamed protein product [Moneuplotes crassus]|uniref:Uncharacterized protein n=1 Tax=Euplotes crassus TaxID=5936 RepID=A0AAD2D2F3_EUPCR|nr:unnamed protein product [Moneuplotes crassus]